MGVLAFAVLGPLEVRRDGVTVVVPGQRRRAVLTALLAGVGTAVSFDVLVDAAWGERLPADPRSALYTVVSRLRTLLGTQVLVAEAGGYRLDIPESTVDSREFERLCREASSVEPGRAAALLDRALGLWRGEAFEDLGGRAGSGVEAHRLDLLRADAYEERGRLALELADPAGAAQVLQELLSRHPFREQAVGLLMVALQRAGRTAEALDRYEQHRRLMADELGLDPSPSLADLQARMLGNRSVGPGSTAGSSPAWVDTSTAMFGREDDLAALATAVAAGRLVTVTGPGGVGKTRLVAQALPSLAGRVGLPALVVDLGSVGGGRAEAAVAEVLGVAGAEALRPAMIDRLRRAPALLVLDNVEHLLPEVTGLAELLTRRCPQARVLATGRHRLGTPGERVLRLAPLGVPGPDETSASAASTPSVRLLMDRVGRGRPGPIGADEVPALAGMAQLLDGMPLALELAASRVAVLGAGAVREALERELSVPGDTGEDDMLLGALQDWSFRLLTDLQRALLAALTAFVGTFELESVRVLAAALPGATTDADVDRALAELVDSSLLVADPEGTTFRLLRLVRTHADASLHTTTSRPAARDAHTRWAVLAATQAAADWTGPAADVAARRLGRIRGDLVAALRWASSRGDLESAAAITGAVQRCPHWSPGAELAELMAEVGSRCGDAAVPHATEALGAAAAAAALRGDVTRADVLGGLAAQRAGTVEELYLAHLGLALAGLYRGRPEASVRHWEAIAEVPGMPPALAAEAHSSMALVARFTGDLEAAAEQAEVAMALAAASGSGPVHAFATYAAGEAAAEAPDHGADLLAAAADEAAAIGAAHIEQVANVALLAGLARSGRHEAAHRLAADVLPALRAEGSWPQLWTALRIVAELLVDDGRLRDAALVLAAADARRGAPPLLGDDVHRYARLRERLLARLGRSLEDRLRAAASMCSREEVADRVLSLLSAEPSGPGRRGGHDRGDVGLAEELRDRNRSGDRAHEVP